MIDRLQLPIDLPYDALAEYCRRWKITRLEVFGSILRDDFGPDSDVDFLVTFDPAARWSLFDMVHAEEELSSRVGRSVDLVERPPIEASKNWIRRRSILESAQTVYAAFIPEEP
jgi:uncharacterized protein